MAKFIANNSGALTEIQPITTSAGAGDASKIAQTDGTGRFDISLMPIGIGAEVASIVASENLSAGDYVNIFDSAGTIKVRRADASSASKEAHGFVITSFTTGGTATVYYGNMNTGVTGLTIGLTYFLSGSTPGAITTTAPSTSGYIVQKIGRSISTTSLLTNIQQPITLA
jgi:hypothetical protein